MPFRSMAGHGLVLLGIILVFITYDSGDKRKEEKRHHIAIFGSYRSVGFRYPMGYIRRYWCLIIVRKQLDDNA
jgi:hypothetical protein